MTAAATTGTNTTMAMGMGMATVTATDRAQKAVAGPQFRPLRAGVAT